MTLKTSFRLVALTGLVGLAALGCGRTSGPLKPWPLPTDPIVFQDAFTGAVRFEAFGNSKLDALGTDGVEQFEGTGCLKVTVPNPGGGYAGGTFVASEDRDLSGNDALTFYAKASRAVSFGELGFGIDNRNTPQFIAKLRGIALTTTWKKYVLPIPVPEKLVAEDGLFFFSGEHSGGSGYTVWFDEVKFERLGTISNPRPSMDVQEVSSVIGATVAVTGTRVTFSVDGTDRAVEHSTAYFSYTSSNPAVATVGPDGMIQVVGGGSATITAKLGTVDVAGSVTVTAAAPPAGPAPTPTVPAGDVISLFSNAYTNVPVDPWSTTWDGAEVADVKIGGDDVKLFNVVNRGYTATEFKTPTIDATEMTRFHMDIWIPSGSDFRVKLVDFGADGVFGGGDDRQHELLFDSGSTPPLVTGEWVGLDVPLTDFTNLTTRGHLAQLLLTGTDVRVLYVDNVYLYRTPPGGQRP